MARWICRAWWLTVATATMGACAMPFLAGGDGRQPIPEGARLVHVRIVGDTVEIRPDTVRAGEIFLVIDEPTEGHLVFVGGGAPGLPENAPLAADGLERLARGDTEGTTMSGLSAGGCGEEADAAHRGMTGPCGNAVQVALLPGRYALLALEPESNATRPESAPITVLTVTP